MIRASLIAAALLAGVSTAALSQGTAPPGTPGTPSVTGNNGGPTTSQSATRAGAAQIRGKRTIRRGMMRRGKMRRMRRR